MLSNHVMHAIATSHNKYAEESKNPRRKKIMNPSYIVTPGKNREKISGKLCMFPKIFPFFLSKWANNSPILRKKNCETSCVLSWFSSDFSENVTQTKPFLCLLCLWKSMFIFDIYAWSLMLAHSSFPQFCHTYYRVTHSLEIESTKLILY